jgi:hypothetical protein
MYDFTNAGPTDIGAGIVLDLYGGKNYVADMMEKTGAKLGEVSNVAAFNTKENAQGFISNSIESGASLFAPHVGTKEGSWQFQQNIFEQLTYKLLDNNILTNKELIGAFNSGLKSKDGKKALKKFNKKYGKKLTNLNEFKNNPKELVELLDINKLDNSICNLTDSLIFKSIICLVISIILESIIIIIFSFTFT